MLEILSGKLSKKIMKYVPKSKVDGIEDAWEDIDGMWIVVKPNWNADRMDTCCHTIHEDNVRELRWQITGIRKLTPQEFESMYHSEALDRYNDAMQRNGMPELTTNDDGWFTDDITISEMVDQCKFQLEQVTDKAKANRLMGFIEYYEYK